MEEIADVIERSFSLNKATEKEKVPELIKRKSTLAAGLAQELGGE